MKAKIDAFLACMKEKGWNIELCETKGKYLPEGVVSRYKNVPVLWKEFIGTVRKMVCSDETEWFLCADDFDSKAHTAWQWNEWEVLSLKCAEGDAEWTNKITDFWNNHLPIFLSVKDGYAYYPISMKDGSIVQGTEQEFEECTPVTSSFADFLEKIIKSELEL